MKILIIVSALDLRFRLGCTPFWWQLFKALYETENELVVVPYLGRAVESPWWETYENPCLRESLLMNWLKDKNMERRVKKEKKNLSVDGEDIFSENWIKKLTQVFTVPKWKNLIKDIEKQEGGFDVCLVINVPLNQFEPVTEYIKEEMGIPVLYYDGDMPTILPQYALDRGFKFSYYQGADLSLYDAFLVNSEGVIPDLKEMGASNVYPFHYAVDPDLIYPVDIEKDRDIAFFGFGSQYREEWMRKMITHPSRQMENTSFVVGGGNFGIDLGDAEMVGNVSIPEYRYFVGRARINLNITRKSHAKTYKTSTGRIFELPAMGGVMVSQPYNGLDAFFEPGTEYIQLKEGDDVEYIYVELLNDSERRKDIATKARKKILQSHTYRERAKLLEKRIKQMRK